MLLYLLLFSCKDSASESSTSSSLECYAERSLSYLKLHQISCLNQILPLYGRNCLRTASLAKDSLFVYGDLQTHRTFRLCHCLTPAKALYLYANEDVTAKPIPPPKSLRLRGLTVRLPPSRLGITFKQSLTILLSLFRRLHPVFFVYSIFFIYCFL